MSAPPRTSRLSLDAFRTAAGAAPREDELLGKFFDEPPGGWSDEADVIVVGSGAAACAAACAAVDAGADVLILEKAALPGGTSAMSGGVLHVYDNPSLRELGIEDPREDALRYLARVGYPGAYRPDAERFGVPPAEFALLEAYYDRGAEVIEALREMGAADITVPWVGWDGQMTPDYFAYLPENRVPRGRGIQVRTPNGLAGHGRELVTTLAAFARSRGARLQLRSRVVALVGRAGAIDGVVCRTGDEAVSLRARKGVIFGTGGMTHNPDQRRRFLRGPVAGGAGVATNTGDLVEIAGAAGVAVGAMNSGFWNQQVLELAGDETPSNLNVWFIPGDGVVMVNRYGQRVANEKGDYHNRSQIHHVWRGGEYPNQLLFMVYDDRTADVYAGAFPIPVAGAVAPHVVTGSDPADLQKRLQQHLDALLGSGAPHVPAVELDEGFAAGLEASIASFNDYALAGADPEFQRGEFPMDLAAHGPAAPDNELPNPTMYPLADGPLHAVVLIGCAFETKCGPVTTPDGQFVAGDGTPVEGLYGAGNCVAGVLGEGYPGGGTTLGPAVVFGYLAGRHAAERETA